MNRRDIYWLEEDYMKTPKIGPLHYGRLGVVGILDNCNLISAN